MAEDTKKDIEVFVTGVSISGETKLKNDNGNTEQDQKSDKEQEADNSE